MYKVVSYYQEDHDAMANFQKHARYKLSEYNFYLRNVLLSILNGTSDTIELINRLNTVQEDVATVATMYYPMETKVALTELLKAHVLVVVDYITASKAKQDLTTIQATWTSNTTEISMLLNSIDPIRWTNSAIVAICTQNANYIHRQIVARMMSDWTGDIEATDLAYKNVIEFADVISNGVIMSHLDKFSKQ